MVVKLLKTRKDQNPFNLKKENHFWKLLEFEFLVKSWNSFEIFECMYIFV